jgi:hypothetical protein
MRKMVLIKSTTVTRATNDSKLFLHFCGSSPRFVDFASGSKKGTDCCISLKDYCCLRVARERSSHALSFSNVSARVA